MKQQSVNKYVVLLEKFTSRMQNSSSCYRTNFLTPKDFYMQVHISILRAKPMVLQETKFVTQEIWAMLWLDKMVWVFWSCNNISIRCVNEILFLFLMPVPWRLIWINWLLCHRCSGGDTYWQSGENCNSIVKSTLFLLTHWMLSTWNLKITCFVPFTQRTLSNFKGRKESHWEDSSAFTPELLSSKKYQGLGCCPAGGFAHLEGICWSYMWKLWSFADSFVWSYFSGGEGVCHSRTRGRPWKGWGFFDVLFHCSRLLWCYE